MDPARAEALKEMKLPQTAAELSDFVYCCRWMSIAIPNFAERVEPLTKILESAYAKSGKRTRRSIRSIDLRSLSWGTTEDEAFTLLQDTLRNAVLMSYPDPMKSVCIFTDASERYWSAVVTQCEEEELEKEIENQKHEPLAFLGSAFGVTQRRWTTFEKEGFAIFQAFNKIDYMLTCQKECHVYTDHRNLLFIFAPLALEPALGRHIVSKVQRWALYLSRFSYVIEHVEGERNVFADILTRWTRGYRGDKARTVCSISVAQLPQMVPAAEEIEWPSIELIRSVQSNYNPSEQGLAWDREENLWKKGTCIWIPEDEELRLKILVCSHCGFMGHRGATATLSTVCENFYWASLENEKNQNELPVEKW